jgi:hypothetical protein
VDLDEGADRCRGELPEIIVRRIGHSSRSAGERKSLLGMSGVAA